MQTAHQAEVFADAASHLVFDSGEVVSPRSARVGFSGLDAELAKAARTVFWRVKSFVGVNCESQWSEVNTDMCVCSVLWALRQGRGRASGIAVLDG